MRLAPAEVMAAAPVVDDFTASPPVVAPGGTSPCRLTLTAPIALPAAPVDYVDGVPLAAAVLWAEARARGG